MHMCVYICVYTYINTMEKPCFLAFASIEAGDADFHNARTTCALEKKEKKQGSNEKMRKI